MGYIIGKLHNYFVPDDNDRRNIREEEEKGTFEIRLCS